MSVVTDMPPMLFPDELDPAALEAAAVEGAPEAEQPEDEKALIKRITTKIAADKKHHEKAFKRMRRDQFVATHGRDPDWSENNYKANIAGRHVKVKSAALYAKNPKAVARRKETLDFTIWDEDPQALTIALQTMQAAQAAVQAAAAEPPTIDNWSGLPVPNEPQMPPGFEQAQAILEDFQQGMQKRQLIDKVGRTLQILYTHFMGDQQPVDFKTSAKQMVRRTCTNGVGYIKLAFQREQGPSGRVETLLSDANTRLAHLERLQAESDQGEIVDGEAEIAELRLSIESLQSEPEIVLREGLIFDWPRATKVIPDKLTKTLVGFIGARHVTVEYDFTVQEVEELFGVDLAKAKFTPYSPDGNAIGPQEKPEQFDGEDAIAGRGQTADGMVRVWEHYDKPSGMVYYVADGYDDWLRPPGKPDVFVENFWPVYALTFNEVDNDEELFPPSDVTLILDQQREYNRSRQGMREHRDAARPRWGYANGALDEDDIKKIGNVEPFKAIGLNIAGDTKLQDVLQAFPVPGVDPNLYETGQLFSDIQLVVGTQEATLGGMSKATATEAAISAGSSQSSDGSSIDDLDAFLTTVARAAGQILLREMSEEQVKLIVGAGAVWPQMTLAEIAGELQLEIQAGSSGKPNQAMEMANWEKMLPFLLQMPGMQPIWLVRETLRRLDDRLDITAAVTAGLPSIMAQNGATQIAPSDPGNTPSQQGGKGANNTPAAPGGPPGSDAAFGSNQV